MRQTSPQIGIRSISVMALLGAFLFGVCDAPAAPKPKSGSGGLVEYSVGSWGGYAIEGSPVTDVVGKWMVPNPDCSQLNTSTGVTTSGVLIWVGLGGFGSNPVEQVGITIICNPDGQAGISVFPFYEFFPWGATSITQETGTAHPIGPGDVMAGEVHYDGTTAAGEAQFIFTLTNQTKNWVYTSSPKTSPSLPGTLGFPTLATLTSAEWAVEACCNQTTFIYSLAPFNSIPFSGASATINKKTGSISTFPYVELELCENSSVFPSFFLQATTATPTPLNSKADSFSVVWGDTETMFLDGPATSPSKYDCTVKP